MPSSSSTKRGAKHNKSPTTLKHVLQALCRRRLCAHHPCGRHPQHHSPGHSPRLSPVLQQRRLVHQHRRLRRGCPPRARPHRPRCPHRLELQPHHRCRKQLREHHRCLRRARQGVGWPHCDQLHPHHSLRSAVDTNPRT